MLVKSCGSFFLFVVMFLAGFFLAYGIMCAFGLHKPVVRQPDVTEGIYVMHSMD